MPYVPAESAVRNWLATRFPDARVVTETPDNLADVTPCIVVNDFGGGDDVPTIDDTNFDVQYFASKVGDVSARDAARLGGEEVRAALRFELPSQNIGGAVVLELKTISKPTIRKYDNDNVRRSIGTYRIRLHCHL